ncbi:MAG: arginine--tRNA ligase [Candidatus Micrarchaeota archaeon]|nr:arginine--tRNA ligase [Candidatus Micrarchaeota archaeon]
MKFIITKSIIDKYPSLRLGVLIVTGIDNADEKRDAISMLSNIQKEIRDKGFDIEKNETILKWREIYRSFGAKPKKHKSSVEALLARVISGENIGHINNLVDVYNYISLKYILPVGGDDTSKVDGNILLKFADGSEKARILGIDETISPKRGEVVYADDKEILCRRWNWRESKKSMMDENTKNAIIVIESLLPKEKLNEALNEMSGLIEKMFGARTKRFILDKNFPSLDIEKGEVLKEITETRISDISHEKNTDEKNVANKTIYTLRNEIEKEILGILKEHLETDDIVLEKPPSEKMGDVAFPCFALAKKMKKSPVEIARDLSEKIKPSGFVKSVSAQGPYLNFSADWGALGTEVLRKVFEQKGDFGKGKGSETVLIETFQANPFKSFHIGHIKNAVFGEAIRRITMFNGHKTITVNFSGDVGTHVAKWLWYYTKFYKGDVPKENFNKWAGDIYAAACEKADEDPSYKEEIEEMNRLIDRRDASIMRVWQEMRDLSYDDYRKIAKELGATVEKWYPESVCEEPGKKKALELLEMGVLKKSDGAVIADLENEGLGVLIFLKKDGTALYAAKDLGLLTLKKRDFEADRFFYIVGSEQELYFKQLFRVYEFAGLSKPGENVHVVHGLVTLKEGKMASRLGNVISYDELKSEMVKRAREEIEKRNPALKNKDEVSKIIAFGAIKFSMLNIDNVKPIKFDWDEALDLQGKTGPYIQYVHARICSILRKAEDEPLADASLLSHEKEVSLLRHLAAFPQAVSTAYRELKPLIITSYVYDLAAKFNEFYQFVPVLKADENVRRARLGLVSAVKQVLENGMWILGIDAPEEM